MPEKIELHHGTSSELEPAILQTGELRPWNLVGINNYPDDNRPDTDLVFLTRYPTDAIVLAKRALERFGGVPIVITAEVDPSRLVPDPNLGRNVGLTDYRQTLDDDTQRTCAHKGPVSKLVKVTRYDWESWKRIGEDVIQYPNEGRHTRPSILEFLSGRLRSGFRALPAGGR